MIGFILVCIFVLTGVDVFALYVWWLRRQMRARVFAKQQAKRKAASAEGEGDGDVIVYHPCNALCQECIDEGYPEWLCRIAF